MAVVRWRHRGLSPADAPGDWVDAFSDEQLRTFEAMAGTSLARLGYHSGPSRPQAIR